MRRFQGHSTPWKSLQGIAKSRRVRAGIWQLRDHRSRGVAVSDRHQNGTLTSSFPTHTPRLSLETDKKKEGLGSSETV